MPTSDKKEVMVSMKQLVTIGSLLLVIHSVLVVPSILYAASELMDKKIEKHERIPRHSGSMSSEEFHRTWSQLIDAIRDLRVEIREMRG